MMLPVKSGGQTISLIEFNPGSRQEAPRVVAPLSIERVGRGGGALMDGVGGALSSMTSRQGKGKECKDQSKRLQKTMTRKGV